MTKQTMTKKFSKSLSEPDPIPKAGIEAATGLMQSGRLFRYGEVGADGLEVSLLEQAFADYLGMPYACGVNSGGCALFLALKAVGVQSGDEVLVNAFTLAPVPGAIDHAGAGPVLVEVTDDYTLDFEDLVMKAGSSNAKVLLLSHMRGHIADMDRVTALCDDLGLILIEDCAHTLGATWKGKHLGSFGEAGCYSTQTFKHLNSGEGGFVVSKDDDIAAKVVLYSGSYMLYAQNGARPPLEVFERWKDKIPNYSMRMSSLQAAVLRPQLERLSERGEAWNRRYRWLSEGLHGLPCLRLPERSEDGAFIASSLQFSLLGLSETQLDNFQRHCDAQGVHLKWFGRTGPLGFTSTHRHWGYVKSSDGLEATDRVMQGLFDMRIPLSLTKAECEHICEIIAGALKTVQA